jgi:hypothetical protein
VYHVSKDIEGRDMDWEAIGAIGEIAGAIGVITSLLYLAVQIHHSNKATRASTYHAITSDVRMAVMEQTNRPEDVTLLLRANQEGLDSLTPEEFIRWNALVVSMLVVFENCFHAHREGIAHEEMWPSARRGLKMSLRENPSFLEWFEINDTLTTGFRSVIVDIGNELKTEKTN